MSLRRSSSSSMHKIVLWTFILASPLLCRLLRLIGVGNGEIERERRSPCFITLHLDVSTVEMHDFLSKIQPDAGAGDSRGRTSPVKPVEDLSDFVGRDADAPIANGTIGARPVDPYLD